MNFCVLTFGCRANQADSFRIEEELCAQGHRPADPARADLVVVNTCAVTAAAEQSARQAIRGLARANPAARIALTGCYATRDPERLGRLAPVVALVPNARKDQLPQALGLDSAPAVRRLAGPGTRGRTLYPLQAQTGCDERCSYCVVPSTRGPSRSRPLAALLADARRLAAAGYLEVILTGVHLGAWGRDLLPARDLIDLLAALEELPADITFRLSSLEPMDCTSRVVERVAGNRARFAPHFHLPLQHASDRLLRAMRRPYSFDDFRRVVDQVATQVPDAAVGTDLIVGFPGETERDVSELERALEALPLAYAHVFSYSDRPGTEAAGLRPKLPAREVRARASRVRACAAAARQRFEAAQVGRVHPALTLADGTVALTDNYLKLAIPPGHDRNDRVRVRVIRSAPLEGEVVG